MTVYIHFGSEFPPLRWAEAGGGPARDAAMLGRTMGYLRGTDREDREWAVPWHAVIALEEAGV